MSLKSRQRTKTSQALNGRTISRAYGGQYYELRLVYPDMTRAQFAPISAFLAAQGGRNGIFYVPVPETLSGAPGRVTGNLATFDNDWKLHLITDGATGAVEPPARASGGTLQTSGIRMRCSLMDDVQEIRLGNRGLIRFELDLVERL
jgi:hypothetical protein